MRTFLSDILTADLALEVRAEEVLIGWGIRTLQAWGDVAAM